MGAKMKKKFIGVAAIVLALHLVFIIIYGTQKIAFHEDEYFTYYTSAGYEGINPYGPIQEKSGMDIQRNFLVTDANRFDFATVAAYQARDVHPPLYYLVMHFVMSLFPNQFYKWFGIALNACCSLVACGGVMFFLYVMDASRYRSFLALLGGLVYAVHPAMITDVMFARMYCMSVMWVVLYMCVFVLLMRNLTGSWKRFFALTLCGGAICYLAFLTHYFGLFVPFFLTLGFCLYGLLRKLIWKEKCLLRVLIYGGSLLAAIGLAVLTFPSALHQIFVDEQGEGAFETLLHTDLFTMFRMFLPVLDKNFFAGMMYPVLGIFAVSLTAGVILLIRRSQKGDVINKINYAILGISLAAGMISVWLLSKTSMFLGDASSRYFYTAASVLLPLMAYTICKAALQITAFFSGRKNQGQLRAVFMAALTGAVLLPVIAGHVQGNVLYLYQEKEETLSYARENAGYPLVMVYDRDTRFKTWYIANELWPFERIIFVQYNDEETVLENEALKTAEKLIVYMDGPEEVLDRMVAQNKNLSSWSLLRHDRHYYVYVLE